MKTSADWHWWCPRHGVVAAEATSDMNDVNDENSYSSTWLYACPFCHEGLSMVDMDNPSWQLRDKVMKARMK